MSLAGKVTTGTYNFLSLILKIILLALSLSLSLTLSLPFVDKKQYFVYLSFNSTLQLINGILSDLQKILKVFSSTAILAIFRTFLAWFGVVWAAVLSKNLALYLKDLKLLVLAISALKLVASPME